MFSPSAGEVVDQAAERVPASVAGREGALDQRGAGQRRRQEGGRRRAAVRAAARPDLQGHRPPQRRLGEDVQYCALLMETLARFLGLQGVQTVCSSVRQLVTSTDYCTPKGALTLSYPFNAILPKFHSEIVDYTVIFGTTQKRGSGLPGFITAGRFSTHNTSEKRGSVTYAVDRFLLKVVR